MQARPVYLKIHLGWEGAASFIYCYSQERKADGIYVQLTGKGEYKLGDFLLRAISRYDNLELARIKAFNIELAVHIVRRRLQHWTRHGWPAVPVPGEEVLEDVDDDEMIGKVMDEKYLRIPGMPGGFQVVMTSLVSSTMAN